jgi:SAM-dependent methyltransferase
MQNVDGLGQKEFNYVFTNFAINLARDVDSTLKGLHRTLKPDGIFAFTVWHRLEWIDVLRTAIRSSISEAPAFPDSDTCLLHFSNYHAWHDPSWVRIKLSEQGFTDVEIEVLPTRHRFTKEEFMENFGGCVVSYLTKCAWGIEAAEKYKEKIAFALEKYLSDKGEGEIELELDALVVTAKKGTVEVPRAM